jgi:hypothetical protein
MKNDYDDNYESCYETFVTLRIYSDTIIPNEITNFLQFEPTESVTKGEVYGINSKKIREINGWFLTSEGFVNSKDCRRHFDFLADKIMPIKNKLKALQNKDCEIDISCFWSSENGQSGPTLSPKQIKKLAELELEIWFDVY